MLTKLINVFLVFPHFLGEWDNVYIFVLANRRPAFRENDKLMSRKIVMLDGLADDLFRLAVRVVVRGVPLLQVSDTFLIGEMVSYSIDSTVESGLQQGKCLVFLENP